jgi:putative phosphoesterase
VLEVLEGVRHVIHAGDIGKPGIVEALARIAPVSAIRGNVDTAPWAAPYPETLTLDLGGRRIHVLHDRKQIDLIPGEAGIDIVVSGHSHRAGIERLDGVLYLNPGAAGPRRFRLPVTVARLRLADPPTAEIVTLDV